MGQRNSNRVSHEIESLPNSFRGDRLKQILDDLNEEDTGAGFSEVIRTGAFVTKITVWDRPNNNPTNDPAAIKRTEATFTRVGAFVSQIVKNTYSQDGLTVIATTTADVTRSGSNQAVFVDVVNTR